MLVTYSLKSAFPIMTINPSTKLIQWNVPPEFKGIATFVVRISDGHGGEVLYNLDVTVSFEIPK